MWGCDSKLEMSLECPKMFLIKNFFMHILIKIFLKKKLGFFYEFPIFDEIFTMVFFFVENFEKHFLEKNSYR